MKVCDLVWACFSLCFCLLIADFLILMTPFQRSVYLESGDMLFYESSKCIHGRPRPFHGSWYSSIFVHYYPKHGWRKDQELEIHYAVPPHWGEVKPATPGLEKLVMSGTSMYEPECPDRWCGTKNTVKWYGPAKEGVVITTGYVEEEGEGNDKEEGEL